MPEPSNLEVLAQEVATAHGIEVGEVIHRTEYFHTNRLRNLIFDATYQGHPVVFKLYDDIVVNVEPESMQVYAAVNKSELLRPPKYYVGEALSLTKGWLVMEKLAAADGAFWKGQLEPDQRKQFVKLFAEYRANFPRQPNRPLALAEQADAIDYHAYRLVQALDKASSKEQQRAFAGKPTVLDSAEFIDRWQRALGRFRQVFSERPLHWGHGHFKAIDVFARKDGTFVLTDFGHTKMLPDGYEPALAIWWDQMVANDPTQPFDEWLAQIQDWTRLFAAQIDEAQDPEVFAANLIERAMAAIMTNVVTQDDMPDDEQQARVTQLYRLIDTLLDDPHVIV